MKQYGAYSSYREMVMGTAQPVGAAEPSAAGAFTRHKLRDFWRRFRRNKMAMVGLVIISVQIIVSILAPVLAPDGYDHQVYADAMLAPSAEHPFGTDNLGRDLLDRCVWGGRWSLSVGIISVGIAAVIGGLLGLIAGFYGGTVDNLLMRFLDIFMSIPPFLLCLAIAAALGSGLFNLMIAVGIGSIPQYARILRSTVLSIKDEEYIEAARATGCGNMRVMLRYVLPNCLSPLLVQVTMGIASAILTCSGMSFLGLGLQPPIAEWGTLLSGGRSYIRQAWWICTFPGILIALAVFAMNVMGDGLRDALDPKLKR